MNLLKGSIALAFLLSSVVLVGCNRTSAPGGPGANKDKKEVTKETTKSTDGTTSSKTETVKETTAPVDSKDTFKITVPQEVNVTQGATNNSSISLSRGSAFKQKVMLKFDAPAPIKVTPEHPTFDPAATKTDIVITVAGDAPVGKHDITVTATPETGSAVTEKITVDVKKK